MNERIAFSGVGSFTLTIIARKLKAMGEPSRLALLNILCDGEKNVTQLVSSTGLSQTNVSKHLRILRDEDLVTSRRKDKMVYYSLKSDLPKEICDRVCRSYRDEIANDIRRLENARRGE